MSKPYWQCYWADVDRRHIAVVLTVGDQQFGATFPLRMSDWRRSTQTHLRQWAREKGHNI